MSFTHLLNNRAARNPTKFFRISGVSALGKDLKWAQTAAYTAVGKICFEGVHFRRDIAAKAF
ncbi:MAG TPA: phosphoribosylglycinamide synthetase C domain-containing protein [Verrucomicrobiae bacterium]|nr:phosphoribosylglycinamide synthetase C domain-containing protein [Verrucomicrobiae bacterium]